MKSRKPKQPNNRFRIIAGDFRGRRLSFPADQDIRPSPDRVRETVFNWLAPWIQGARCLDLFAGSGALGFEALSRGAASVDFVDHNRVVCDGLRANVSVLNLKHRTAVNQSTAQGFLSGCDKTYDLIFLDPPFHQGMLLDILSEIEQGAWLVAGGFVYGESEAGQDLQYLSANWQLTKSKTASKVAYHLLRRENRHS
ncbi:MAG: 16S rRNA (guanine(966)-N(2))-methyltransferase RsmD [Pseudomonadota bacterium]